MDPMVYSQTRELFILVTSYVILAVLIGWVVYLTTSVIRRRQQNQMQKALLEKFSSAQDFAHFMQSPAGQKYLMSFTDAVTTPRSSILSSIRLGFVLACLGMGSLVAARNYPLFCLGWLSFFVGVGFLISAGVSYFLSKKSGWDMRE